MPTETETTIQAGTIGFDIASKRRINPKYRFNTTVTVPVVGEDVCGCGVYARRRLIVLVEGKRLAVPVC